MAAFEPSNTEEPRWTIVADADEDAARTLAAYLLHQRFRAYPTGRGAEALLIAASHPVGLAVIDVALGDMAGRDLVRQLRATDPALPVVMTTTDFDPEIEVGARQLGIIQYIQKPFDFRRLGLIAHRIFVTRLRLVGGARER